MTWFRVGGAGIPTSLKNAMNAVFNKKFGTSGQNYPPKQWPDDVNLLGPLPEGTASGPIANFSDGADGVPIKNWLVTLPASLDGYSEVNGVRSGKNLLNVNAITNTTNPNNATIVNNGNGTITVTTTTQQNVKTAQKLKDICPNVKVGETYFLNATTTGNQKIIYLHQASVSWTFGTAKAITSQMLESDVSLYASGTNSTATISDLSLTYGSRATAYEPYQTPTQYTASLGRTIYGGTADIVNGEGTETHKEYTLDNLTWSGGIAGGADWCWYVDLSADNLKLPSNSAIFSGICDNYTPIRYNGVATNQNTIALRSNGYLYVNNGSDTNEPTGKVTIELATPTDFTFAPITPTPESALGVNNFWADEGDTTVVYRRDIDLALQAVSSSRGLMMASRPVTQLVGEESDPDQVNELNEEAENTEEQEGDNDAR